MYKVIKKNSYWKDVFLQASGNTIAQVIGILGMPILTRLYAPEAFATQAIFVQVVGFLAAFISFRFEYFLQLLDDITQSYSFILWILCVGFIMTLFSTLVIFILNITNFFDFFNIITSSIFYLAPVAAYSICISTAIKHEAQRQGDFKSTSIAEVSSKFSYIASGAILSLFLNNLGLILTTVFGSIGRIISLRGYFLSFISNIKKINIDKKLLNVYRGRAKGMVLSNTILSFSSLLPMFFISKQFGANTLGQFSLVMATVFLPSGLIGSAVGNVFYQRSAQLWNLKNFIGLKYLWTETLVKLILFGLPIYLIIFLVSSRAYPFVFGNQWLQAGEVAKLMSIAAFFSFLAGPLDRMSLVLGIGYYLPLIHFCRVLMIISVMALVYILNLEYIDFILIFSIGMSLIYFFDIILCRFYFLQKWTELK
ncbi:lipopolysaccharide biosynthesis protein [Psychrobacter faecalis]